jgi:hypothetical protein
MNIPRASYFVTVSMIAVCGLIWWAPCVRAQTLSSDSLTTPKTAESGWFGQNSKSATSPHDLLDMADNRSNADFSSVVNDHDTAASISHNAPPILPLDLYTALREPSSERPVQPRSSFDARDFEFSLLNNSGVLPGSFLYPLQISYMQWESRLADTVSPISHRGMLVYPFLEISVASGHLPISMYVPPLRGSDTLHRDGGLLGSPSVLGPASTNR